MPALLSKPLPEAEGAIKAFLRSTMLVGKRAFLGAPDDPTYPLMISHRIGGGPVVGSVPIDVPLMHIDVVGDPERRGKDRYEITNLANALRVEIESCGGADQPVPGVRLDWGQVMSGPTWRPLPIDEDPEEEQARVFLTAEFGLRAVPTS